MWTYENPYPAVGVIKEYVAFYPDRIDAIEVVLNEFGRRYLPMSHGSRLFERGKIVQRGHARSVRVPSSAAARTHRRDRPGPHPAPVVGQVRVVEPETDRGERGT